MRISVSQRTFLLAALLVFVGAVFFSTKAVMVKLAYRYGVDSLSLLTLRMLFALPLYLFIGRWYQRRQTQHQSTISSGDWWRSILLGVCGYYLASFLDFEGLNYVSAGLERLILFMYPTLVILIQAVIWREPIRRIHLLALGLTYIGIALAFGQSLEVGDDAQIWLGGGLIFGAAFTYAIYIVGSGRLLPRIGTIRYTTISMSSACVAVILHHAIGYRLELFHFATEVYYLSVLMAAIATVLPSFMISEGIRIIGASNASIVGSVGPVSTIILAYFFLGETFRGWQIVGTGLVIGGIVLIALQAKK